MTMLGAVATGRPALDQVLDWKHDRKYKEGRDVSDDFCPVISEIPRKKPSEPVQAKAEKAKGGKAEPISIGAAPFGYGFLTQLRYFYLRLWQERFNQCCPKFELLQNAEVQSHAVFWLCP